MMMSVILGFRTSIRKLTCNVSFFDYNNLKISLKITFFVCVCFCVETAYKSFHPICLLPKKKISICVCGCNSERVWDCVGVTAAQPHCRPCQTLITV